jgi:hypothetical protein
MTRLGIAPAAGMLVVGCLVSTAIVGCSTRAPQPEILAAGFQASVPAKTSKVDQNEGTGEGMAALREASQSGKYLFVFFFKAEDEPTLAMRKVFGKTMEKAADRAQSVAVNITDASEKAVVDKFDLTRAPMPLVLAIAPNGAITGGFPTKFEEKQLLDAFATPGSERMVKSLQDGKMVFVCVQNDKTKSNDAAMQGIRDFKADARFVGTTEIVTLDPRNKKEASFLVDLKVSPDIAEATTVFVVPPGKAIGKFEGATNKDALVELISKASSGCCCGPGGCCSKK